MQSLYVAEIAVANPALHGPLVDGSTSRDSTVALYKKCEREWESLISQHEDFATVLDEKDTLVCSLDELAVLIKAAPDPTIRHALREVSKCRRDVMMALGLRIVATATSLEVFAQCDQEWDDLLDMHPMFKRWFALRDRLTCSEQTVRDAIRMAPTVAIRQAMRQHYLFRMTVALHTHFDFS